MTDANKGGRGPDGKRFQFMRYPVLWLDEDDEGTRLCLSLGTLRRLWFHRYTEAEDGAWVHVYRWRLAFGPFEVRRWA